MSAGMQTCLAIQQAALVSALMRGGVAPTGFEASRLQVAAESLSRKRCRAAARAWPALARALGEEFRGRFAAYADTTPLPPHGGSLADGRGFADWLNDRGQLPEDALLQILAVDLRFKRNRTGLFPRKLLTIRAAWLTDPRRLVVAIRWPCLGERWLSLRWWR